VVARLRKDLAELSGAQRPYAAEALKRIEALDGFLFKAMRSIQPLDMGVLLEHILSSMQSQVSDKDVVLLLGCTGAGKSTIVHYLAGSKMVKKFIKGSRSTYTVGKTIRTMLLFSVLLLFHSTLLLHFSPSPMLPLQSRKPSWRACSP
jgi:hypothetical protein